MNGWLWPGLIALAVASSAVCGALSKQTRTRSRRYHEKVELFDCIGSNIAGAVRLCSGAIYSNVTSANSHNAGGAYAYTVTRYSASNATDYAYTVTRYNAGGAYAYTDAERDFRPRHIRGCLSLR